MNAIRTIIKNTGASLFSLISVPFSSFVLVLFIARYQGPSSLGVYSYAFSLVFIFQALSGLGFSYLVTREVAQDKTKSSKVLVNASIIGFIWAIAMVGAMCLTANLLSRNSNTIGVVYVLSLSLVPYTLNTICESICKAYERMEYIAISHVTGSLFTILIGVQVLKRGYGLSMLMWVITATQLLTFLLCLFFTLRCVRAQIGIGNEIDYRFCKWILRATPVFALISIAGTVRFNIDVPILAMIMKEGDVGLYSAANKVVNVFKLGVTCYMIALQPVLFKLFELSKEKFKSTLDESQRYLFMLIFPIIVTATVSGKEIILLLFGESFLPSTKVFTILIWMILLAGLNQIYANTLIASKHEKMNLQSTLLAMLANILLNVVLIPKFGIVGAGIANIASGLLNFLIQYHFVSKYLFKVFYLELAIKPLIASCAMLLVMFLLKNISLPLGMVMGSLSYLISLVALRAINRRDVDLFVNLMTGKEKRTGRNSRN